MTDSQENCLNSYDSSFHLTLIVLLHYLVKIEDSLDHY